MLTIAPPPLASRCGVAALLSTNAVVTLKWNERSRKPGTRVEERAAASCRPRCSRRCRRRPNSATACRRRSRRRASLSFTSHGTTNASRPDAAHVGGDLVELFLGAGGEQHVRAGRGERAGDRGADAAARTGDDRDLAVEPECVERVHSLMTGTARSCRRRRTGLSPPSRSIVIAGRRLHAARHLLRVDDLAAGPQLRAHRNRRREAHLVDAVVDAHRDALTRTSWPRKCAASDIVRKPWAIGAPNGPALARSVSTWIHWLSSVASANLLIWSWVIVTESVGPELGADRAEQVLGGGEGRGHGSRRYKAGGRRADAPPMAGVPRSPRPSAPLQNRSTSVTRTSSSALVDCCRDPRRRPAPADHLRPARRCAAGSPGSTSSRRLARRLDAPRRPRAGRSTRCCSAAPSPASTSRCTARVTQRDRRLAHDDGSCSRNLLDHPDVQGIIVRAADQTVFDREARWRTLVGESPIGIFEVDLDGRCTFVNPRSSG